MLQHNTPNKQYLSILKEAESDRIQRFFELFSRQFLPIDNCVPFAVCTSRSDFETVQTWTDRLNIQVDLPLEKYRLVSSSEIYIEFLYVENGTMRKGHRPSESVAHGRGLTIIEGLAMVAVWPDVLEDHAIDLISSRYSIECIPTLYRWDKRTHLSAVCPDVQDAMCGAPIVKHEITFNYREWTELTDEHFQARLQGIMT